MLTDREKKLLAPSRPPPATTMTEAEARRIWRSEQKMWPNVGCGRTFEEWGEIAALHNCFIIKATP
jgi:hypothetical protein